MKRAPKETLIDTKSLKIQMSSCSDEVKAHDVKDATNFSLPFEVNTKESVSNLFDSIKPSGFRNMSGDNNLGHADRLQRR
jgi:hypothetical protein